MNDNICLICKVENSIEEVETLRCTHIICWKCLDEYIKPRLAPKIMCPIQGCGRCISDNTIRKVLSEAETVQYEQLSLQKMDKRVECMLPDCSYVFICPSKEVQFDCPQCSLFNCLICNAPHRFISCEEYINDADSQEWCEKEKQKALEKFKRLKREEKRHLLKVIDETDIFNLECVSECSICNKNLSKEDGIMLRCSHTFCRYCLINYINTPPDFPIRCPSGVCAKDLEEREIIKLITSDQLGIYVYRCNAVIKGKLGFTFQCQTPNCAYFVEYSMKPSSIFCPLCKVSNCTSCYACHGNESCNQFKERIRNTPEGRNLIDMEEKIKKRELMRCLKCHTLLKKIIGCNWIQCSNCKFEMCWVLQMARWGPGGRNDNSGGCRCGVDGKQCDPMCTSSCIPHNG